MSEHSWIVAVVPGRAYPWATFLQGLREGQPSAYLVLLGLVVGIAIVLRASVKSLMKKDSRR